MVFCFMRRLWWFFLLVFFVEFCGKTTPADVCFPAEGRFIRGEHYVDSSFVSEEGTWNYAELVAYYQKHIRTGSLGQCLPISEKPTMSEQIEKLEKKIDLLK